MYSVTVNWEYKTKFYFPYGGTLYFTCTMKVLGKIIDASGLDMSLFIAEIYGTTTAEQLKSGKHVYKSFEGYLTSYLSLYKIYLKKINRHNSSNLTEIYDRN